MRILVVTNYFSEKSGGIEFVAFNLVREFRKAGHEVRWVACDLPDRPHRGAPEDVPLRAWNITEAKLGFPYPLPHPVDLWRLRAHVQWCDLIHLHDSLYAANQWVSLCAARYSKPVVVTQHVGLVPYREKYKVWLQRVAHATLGRIVLRRAVQVVFVGEPVRRWFVERIPFRRTPMVIPNGVDVSVFRPLSQVEIDEVHREVGLPAGRSFILFVGRFTQKKGVHLIHAVAQSKPEWSWVLIGAAMEEDPRVWALPNVQVLPPQDQQRLRLFYGAADLLALPSVGEGFPLVIGEALACGTPVMCSSETAEAVPGLAQCVFTSEPDAVLLQSAIESALSNVDQRRQVRLRVAEFVRDVLDWRAIGARYQEVFRDAQRRLADELTGERNLT
jgi:glycosyltransferase involved in cell wall biosynthesis